jgi:hypothetical protein
VLLYTHTKQQGADMLQNKPLTAEEADAIIAQLEAIADRLFLAGNNYLGNTVQEVTYSVEANLAEQIG